MYPNSNGILCIDEEDNVPIALLHPEFPGHPSDSKLVETGVPHGSILGPLLFMIYVNDLPSCLNHSEVNMYAGDTAFYYGSSNIDDVKSHIQSDLARVYDWLKSNKPRLNVAKTTSMVIRHQQKRRYIRSISYGGIRRSSASPHPSCDGTPSASVWPSPRQTPGPPCPHPSDRTPPHATTKRVNAPPRHGPAPRISTKRIRWAESSAGSRATCP